MTAEGTPRVIRQVTIRNFKSIPNLTLELGRVNVLIGVNGSGKSNILEALALASAAAQDKLDNEFLISRGIRVTDTNFMRTALRGYPKPKPAVGIASEKGEDAASEPVRDPGDAISISVEGEPDVAFRCELFPDETASYPQWKQTAPTHRRTLNLSDLRALLRELGLPDDADGIKAFQDTLDRIRRDKEARSTEVRSTEVRSTGDLPGFLIFAPENSALRTFQSEGQILPLGIRGEGLFAHLKGLNTDRGQATLKAISERLKFIEWFESFDIPEHLAPGERSLRIRDRFLADELLFDQRSANEGFLFLLFYVTLFTSPETPRFFAIDNVDSSLNPKMCAELVRQIVALSRESERQVILTTHNPAILDGLDLTDPEQRLFVVDRSKQGETRVNRVPAPKPIAGAPPVSLSEAFLRGYIGGLPKNF